MKRNFEIGEKIRHKVDIKWTAFGLEIYKVDGKVVLKTRNLWFRGSRKILANQKMLDLTLED